MAEEDNVVENENAESSSEEENTEVSVEVETDELSADASETEDEHAQYTDKTQKRINRLTKKMREAERREQAAIEYAKAVQKEAEQVKAKLQTVDQGYLSEYGNRLNIEKTQTEERMKEALNKGDTDEVVKHQTKLAELAVSADRYNNLQKSREQAPAQNIEQPVPQPTAPTQEAPPTRAPDPKAEQWAEQNEWFGKDEAMTFAAFGIHQAMVQNEGFDPQSDEYYDELNTRIRKNFPQKFQQETEVKPDSGRKPVQNVAGNSRSRSKGRKKQVMLTPGMKDMARRLNVPIEEYAKYVKN